MRGIRCIAAAIALGLALSLGAGMALAQGGQTGGITGEVRDPTGAIVPGATVQIINDATGVVERELITGPDGLYSASLLRPGTYRVEATAPGFRSYRAVVPVRIGEALRHVATLEVGDVAEVVEVTAAATLVDTGSATTGQPIDSQTLAALPIPVPNFMYLLTLSPGSMGEPPDVRGAGRTQIAIQVHGQRSTNNAAALEGINVNDFNLAHFDTIPLPNPNALHEFRVATSLYDATQGSKGGGNMNLLLRTGTSQPRFSAYWQHRNTVLNANEWFTKRDQFPVNERGRHLNNVLGFSGSGPVPLLGGFIFGNIQGVRSRNAVDPAGAIARPTVPVIQTAGDGTTSAAMLAGLLPPGFTVADIDPVAVNILNLRSGHFGGEFLVPRLGQTGCIETAPGTMSCTFSGVIPGESLQHTVTYDRPLRGERDTLSLRWFHDNAEDQRPFGQAASLAGPQNIKQRNRFATIQYQSQINPRQLNNFKVGYSRFVSVFDPTPLGTLADIGSTRPNEADIPDMHFFTIAGAFSGGVGANDDRGTFSNSYFVGNTYSLVRGRHTLRVGGEWQYFQLNRFNRFVTRGFLSFGAIPDIDGTGVTSTGFQNFLMGRPTAIQVGGGTPGRYYRADDLYFFVQDDFRIFPTLTLNLGLRWEGLSFSTEKFNMHGLYRADFAAEGRNPFGYPRDMNVDGFTGIPGNELNNCLFDRCRQLNNWAPRIGFSWDMFGDQSTALRGGYGIYYQRLSNQTTLQSQLAPPVSVQLIRTEGQGVGTQILGNPFPDLPAGLVDLGLIPQRSIFVGVSGDGDPNNPANAPLFMNEDGQFCFRWAPPGTPDEELARNCAINLASFTSAVPTLRAPYNQQWNLTLQRQLWGNWAMEVGYVGSHYVGGIGIFNPFVQLASPDNPIVVTAEDGTQFTITENTQLNEPLRHAVLGLSGATAARFTGNIGRAFYHGLETTLSHRFSRGLYFQAAHTWSKTIDNVSGSMNTDEFNPTRAGQGGANLIGFGNIEPRLSRSVGDFDRRHRVVFSYTWDLPIPQSGIWGSQVFQGWSLSGVTYYQHGLPFSVTSSLASGLGNRGINTPDLDTSVCPTLNDAHTTGPMQDRVDQFLNPACFVTPGNVPFAAGTALTYGNVPRNAFRGPMQSQWDFSLGKTFTLAENHQLRFRTDFFNAFNQVVFRSPAFVDHNTPATFGRINQTVVPARLIQFGLRYDF